MASVLTNDPKQRPMFNFVSTIFSYGVPILLSNVVTFNILPKYDNQYNMPMLKEMTLFYIAVSFVCCIVSMMGIARADNDEVWKEASAKVSGKQEKIGLKQMWEVLSKNKDVVCIILGPSGMREIGTTGSWAFLLWVACTVGMTAGRMLLSVAAGTMRADVTDGEEHRSGNFMPSVIAGVYSLFDKGMSSICAMIATAAISLIGYVNTVPQMGDEVTSGVFWMGIGLSFVLPIIGFLCNIFAMKNYTLDVETLAQVQADNQAKRDAAAERLHQAEA